VTKPTTRGPSRTELFLAKVDTTGDCWQWTGSTVAFGYGQFNDGHTMVKAHRWLYELAVGPIPEGLVLDHLCRNPGCVRPSHLEPVTDQINILRGIGPTAVNAAKTHCAKGHSFEGEDAERLPNGARKCRTCNRDKARDLMRQKRAANGGQGTCSVCGLAYRLRPRGGLWRHYGITAAGFSTGEPCPGVGKPPAP